MKKQILVEYLTFTLFKLVENRKNAETRNLKKIQYQRSKNHRNSQIVNDVATGFMSEE